jgi:glycosyltransferase involved in cell wall biosynthesis
VLRLAVYTDYVYHREGGKVFGERAFTLFLAQLAAEVDELTLVGRLDPDHGASHYPLGDRVRFVPLPYYSRLDRFREVAGALRGAVKDFWRLLPNVDCVWVLGPNPFAIVFAILGLMRGKQVVLGVRSDMRIYVASRHPGRRRLAGAALALDMAFRLLGRRCPVIAVGPELAKQYVHSREVLEILVSLVDQDDVVGQTTGSAELLQAGLEEREEVTILSVGRLESEKNPLLLADVLALLHSADPRWRLIVCGEGPLAEALSERLASLGLQDAAELRGYVPLAGLRKLYEDADVLLHASWTEGFPQVLLEAFAAGLPIVATDVGGIRAAAGNAVRLIPPGDPEAAAREIITISRDEALRLSLVERGREFALQHTTQAELERVMDLLRRA